MNGWNLLIAVAVILYFAVEFHLYRKDKRNKKKESEE